MNEDQRQDLMFRYVLGDVDAEERERVRALLAEGRPEDAGALAEARAVVAHLPLLLDPAPPPQEARQKLLARVRRNRAPAPAGGETPRAAGRVGFWRAARPWALAAAAALLAAAATWGVMASGQAHQRRRITALQQRLSAKQTRLAHLGAGLKRLRTQSRQSRKAATRMRSQVLRLRQQVQQARQATHALQARLAEFQTQVAGVREAANLVGPAMRMVTLQGAGPQPDARARLLWNPRARASRLYAENLQPLPPDRTYQLWFITPQKHKVSAGTFDVNAAGGGAIAAEIPPAATKLAVAAVTTEPAGGSPQPTGKILLKGKAKAK